MTSVSQSKTLGEFTLNCPTCLISVVNCADFSGNHFFFAVLVKWANLPCAFLLCWCGEAMFNWKPSTSLFYQQDRRLQYTHPLHRTPVLNTFVLLGLNQCYLLYKFTYFKIYLLQFILHKIINVDFLIQLDCDVWHAFCFFRNSVFVIWVPPPPQNILFI